MSYILNYNHGDLVIVLDRHGNHEARGTIVGRHAIKNGAQYDVQPSGELSMSARIIGVPESRLRRIGKPALLEAKR